MTVPTRQQWEQAKQAGENARRAGRKRDKSPMYAMGEAGQALREAWRQGWDQADEERKR